MLVSVITAVYNNLPGLKITATSLEGQLFADFEWIVMDGGSTDGGREWLADYRPDFRFISASRPDRGLYHAMNRGIAAAGGEYLMFLNSDDALADECVLASLRAHVSRERKPVLIYGDSLDLDRKGRIHYRTARDISRIGRGMITQHQAMFFLRSAIAGMGYEYEKYPLSADYALIARIISKEDPADICQIPEPVCRFLLGGINEQQRLQAVNDDYLIRTGILGFSPVKARLYQLAHLLHTLLKKSVPQVMKKIRYR